VPGGGGCDLVGRPGGGSRSRIALAKPAASCRAQDPALAPPHDVPDQLVFSGRHCETIRPSVAVEHRRDVDRSIGWSCTTHWSCCNQPFHEGRRRNFSVSDKPNGAPLVARMERSGMRGRPTRISRACPWVAEGKTEAHPGTDSSGLLASLAHDNASRLRASQPPSPAPSGRSRAAEPYSRTRWLRRPLVGRHVIISPRSAISVRWASGVDGAVGHQVAQLIIFRATASGRRFHETREARSRARASCGHRSCP